MKAIGALRESSGKQVGDGREGLEDQRISISEFAHELGIEVVGWEIAVESASKWDRPQWEAVIDRVIERHRRSEIDALIFHKVDRETRNPLSSVPPIERALRAGIRIYFAADKLLLDPHDPVAVYRYVQKMAEANAYAKTVGERWKDVHHRRAQRNKHPTNQKLFGFRYEDDKRMLDEVMVPIAREAIQRFLKCRLLSPVLRWLKDEQKIGVLNSIGALRRWLQNCALKGETQACGQIIHHDALVDDKTWEAIQIILTRNKGNRAPRKGYLPIPFHCCCGARLIPERHDSRVYIRCRACNRKPHLRLDRFQAMLSLATVSYINERRYLSSDARFKAEVRARVLASLAENRKALARLKTSWEAFADLKMEWKGPKETIEKKEQSLISRQATLEEEENRLLEQLAKLPQIEVLNVQEAWEEVIKPYEVIFSPPLIPDPPKFDEQNPDELLLKSLIGTVPEFYKINNLRPFYPSQKDESGDSVLIPEPLSLQGVDIPNGWSDQGWQPSEKFKSIIAPIENWVWDFWRSLDAEAFLDDRGHIKLRFQLKVLPRRLNETPRYTSPY